MTNCAETAYTPHEQKLVDVAAILAADILRLRERQSLSRQINGQSLRRRTPSSMRVH
jgi:hypothetical protein